MTQEQINAEAMFLDKTLRPGYPAVKMHAICIPVKNLAESIAFYEKLDFSIRTSKTNETSVSVYMQLSKNELFICLTQHFVPKAGYEKIWFELKPIEMAYDETLEDLGFEEPEVYTGMVEFQDPNGANWRLIELPDYVS